eukprot:8587507-Karenia_brevis.AAC.1
MAVAEESIKITMQCQNAPTEKERDEAREVAWAHNGILVIDGPPGSGKTFVQRQLIEKILGEGGRVLYVFVTANNAARAREVYGDLVDIDTFAGALGDGTDAYINGAVLEPYAGLFIDECFQMSEELFKHLLRLHTANNRVVTVVCAGDKHQMGSPGGRSAHLSPLWDQSTFTTTLTYDPNYQQRSSDQPFLKMLNKMRVGMPANKGGDFSVPQICRGHRAWPKDHHWPTPDDMKWLWDNHRNT